MIRKQRHIQTLLAINYTSYLLINHYCDQIVTEVAQKNLSCSSLYQKGVIYETYKNNNKQGIFKSLFRQLWKSHSSICRSTSMKETFVHTDKLYVQPYFRLQEESMALSVSGLLSLSYLIQLFVEHWWEDACTHSVQALSECLVTLLVKETKAFLVSWQMWLWIIVQGSQGDIKLFIYHVNPNSGSVFQISIKACPRLFLLRS